MGGGLYYEYLGINPVNGKYKYLVSAKVYRYCEPGSANLNNKLLLGVYNEDPSNPNATSKTKYGQFNINRISLTFIQPPNPGDSCTFLPNVCVQEGYYSGIINLDASIGGYHLIADECCRNGNIVNINNPTGAGFAFYAFVPPTNIVNNSPVFALPPIPFLCTNDTASMLNTAIDPDGDVLIYNFVRPLKGVSVSAPNPTPSPYPWPIPKVNYSAGHSVFQPLGAAGGTAIDTTTGLTQFFSPFTGFYVVEIEIREFRQGQLIGVSRRGLQLIFIPCPNNDAPVLSNTPTTYTINESDSICINFSATDINSDSLFLTYGGDVFDSTIVNPVATMMFNNDTSLLNVSFCWITNCNTGRTAPYQFFASVSDNGCPAKTEIKVFTINVIPFIGDTMINGNDSLCIENLFNQTYSVPFTQGISYNWMVENGVIMNGQGTSQIVVSFNTTGPYSVSLVETNSRGCNADTLKMSVFVEDIGPQAGSDTAFCAGNTIQIGSTSVTGWSYLWSPATNLSSNTISNPTLTLVNSGNTPIALTYVVTVTNLAGCTRTDSVTITILPLPETDAGMDTAVCSGQPVTLGTTAVAGYGYVWQPDLFLSDDSIAQPVLLATNFTGVNDTLIYWLTVSNGYCQRSDSVSIIVKPATKAQAGGDVNLCTGDTIQLGSNAIGGTVYNWSPANGLSSTTVSNPFAIIPDTGTTATIYTYVLTTDLNGCLDTDTINIGVNISPITVATATPSSGCTGSTVFLQGSGAFNYEWTDLSNPGVVISTNDTLTILANTTVTYVLYGVTTTNCHDYDTITVAVNAPPQLTLNAIPDSVCYGDTITLIVNGANTYIWQNNIQPGTIISTSDTLVFIATASLTMYVTGTDTNGCSSTDSVQIGVKPLPVVYAGNDVTACAFDTLQLGATPVNGYSYLWLPATNLSSDTIANPIWVVSDTAITTYTYILTVTNSGCTQSDTVNISINPAPAINVLPANPEICAGDQLNLSAFGAVNYLWYEVNNPSTILSNTSTLVVNPTGPVSYVVQGSNTTGCKSYDTINVAISPAPVISSAINPSLICAGDSATIALSGASSYQWELSSNPGVVVWTDSVLTQPFNTTTTFIIVAQSDAGCIDTSTITVNVNPLPQTFAGNDINICAGDTIQLGGAAQAGVTYNWSPANGLSSTTAADPTVIIPDTNQTVTFTYILTAQLNGCTLADTVNITTNLTPFVQINGNDSICADNAQTLLATGAISYTWQNASNPGVIIGISDTLQLTPNQSGTYIVTGTTSPNCSSSDTITITINQLPTIIATAATDSICKGDTITLFAQGGVSYTWVDASNPGVVISTNNALNIFLNNTATYLVTGTNALGCVNNDTITINAIDLPNTPTLTGDSIICDTNNIYLYIANSASVGLSYNWIISNGIIVNGQGTDSIMVQWNTSGPYQLTCIGTNVLGCNAVPTGISAILGNHITLPIPTGNVVVCDNDTVTYSALANPNFVYNWIVNGGTILSGNGTSSVSIIWNLQPPTTGQIWYTVSTIAPDTLCFTVSDTLEVTINNAPAPPVLTVPTAMCLLDTFILNVTPVAGNTYNWAISNGSIINGNGTAQITVVFQSAGMQMVTVFATSAAGCESALAIANINVNALPAANAGNDTTACIGELISLNANGGSSYLWSPATGLSSNTISNPTVTITGNITYTVLVGDNNGCSALDSIQITMLPQLTATATADQNSICQGNTAILTATGGNNFAWIPATGLSSSNNAITNANPLTTTTYSVIVNNTNFCADTATVTLTVNALPNISTNNNLNGCNGDSVLLMAQGATTYSWLPISGLSNSNVSNPMALVSGNTTYTVTGTDASGCTSTATVAIVANTQPDAAFDTSYLAVNCNGLLVSFTNQSTNASTYLWDFGNGNTSNDVNPQHSFGFGNTYSVTLFAYNGNCVDSTVQIINQPTLNTYFDSIPNVFTPNGDGKNDCFNVTAHANLAACTSVEIYNRWGNLLYKSNDTNACWDGKNENTGEAVPKGTYIYLIKVNDQKFNGTVNLLK